VTDLPPRVLGLDWGTKRIGVAVTDPFGDAALPLDVLPGDRETELWTRLRKICEEKDIKRIVVGLPVNMDGTHGSSAAAAKAFALRVEKETGIPVETTDERLTSCDADGRLAETGMRWKDRKKRVDQVAASLILAAWIDKHRPEKPPLTGDSRI
jgi:putative Holliday junction resolvase